MNDFLSKKLISLGILQKTKALPLANYKPCIVFNNLIFISGQLPLVNGKIKFGGKIGKNIEGEKLKESMLITTSNLFWNLSTTIENEKKKIKAIKFLNIKGYLNCTENFTEHPKILNETSDLIVKILGKKNGEHSRSVVGVNSLPLNSPVEIDGVFSLII